MGCPQCGSKEEHVVVDSVTFCRLCGPRVWAEAGSRRRKRQPAEAQDQQFETVSVGKKRRAPR